MVDRLPEMLRHLSREMQLNLARIQSEDLEGAVAWAGKHMAMVAMWSGVIGLIAGA